MKRLLLIIPLILAVLVFAGFRTGGYRTNTTSSVHWTFGDDITVNDTSFLGGAVVCSSTVNIAETITFTNSTADADTALYIKHYGSRTTDYGIVIDMDTSANTAGNVIGIDMSGSNAMNNSSDYYFYRSSSAYWRGDGTVRSAVFSAVTQIACPKIAAGSSAEFAIERSSSYDISLHWTAGNKGDIIFRDGNALGNTNTNFFQIQDSNSVVQLAFPNSDIRGQATFTRNTEVDTVPGMVGVSTNSFIFLTAKRSTALTGALTWTYLAAESILVHILAADTTGAGVTYCWFRVE